MSSPEPLQPYNPYAPSSGSLEQVPVQAAGALELADRASRFVAAMIDWFVWILMLMPSIIGTVMDQQPSSAPRPRAGGIGGVIFLALFILWAIVTTYLVERNGQTLGKKALNIKVVRSDGSKASLARIFWLRNVLNSLPFLVFSFLYTVVDLLMIFSDSRQCIHDRIADTIVVKDG